MRRREKYILTRDDRYSMVELRKVGQYSIFFESKYAVLVRNDTSGTCVVFHVWDHPQDLDVYTKLDLFKTRLRYAEMMNYNELFKLARICGMSAMALSASSFVAQIADRKIKEITPW